MNEKFPDAECKLPMDVSKPKYNKLILKDMYVAVFESGDIPIGHGDCGQLPLVKKYANDITDAGRIARRCRITVEVIED